MNIVSGSRLMQDGYSFKSENNGCSIYMRDMFYGHAPLVNGLFLFNLERDVTHIHSVNAKRCKVDNDSPTYLWHCRLDHIGVKRMKSSMQMDFWSHLITNHLSRANHVSWVR